MSFTCKEPKLRFSEFSGEWVEKKIGELCSIFKSGEAITSENIFEKGLYPVFGGNGLRGYTNSFTHDGFYFLIGRQGALCGNINRTKEKAFISEHAIAVEANETSDTEWLAQRLDYYNLNKLSESSAQPGLAVNKVIKFKLFIPSKPEQEKIASFLTAVDTKIEQLTCKEKLLEKYKKSVLQKLFSQELRFTCNDGSEFSEWEEKRLGEIGQIITGKTPSTSNDDFWGGNIQFITPTDINENIKYQILTARKIVKQPNTKVLPKGSIVYTCIASIGKMAITTLPSITNQQINSIIAFENVNNEFLYYALLKLTPYIKSTQANTTLPIINKTEFSRFKIHLPSLPEQTKIANFLSAIDEKCLHVKTQIEQTKQFKKALLQQMFV